MKGSMSWFVLILCTSLILQWIAVQARGKTQSCPKAMVGAIRLETAMRNTTCDFVFGTIQMCTVESNESYVWNTICDEDWTERDAQVACRQLGYSAIGATDFKPNLAVTKFTNTVPECEGGEPNITSCALRTSSDLEPPCESIPGVNCFLNDTTDNICSKLTNSIPTVNTTTSQQEVLIKTEHTVPFIIVPTTSSQSRNTTSEDSDLTDFFTHGIAAVITLSLFVMGLLVLVIALVILRWIRNSAEKQKQSRIPIRNGQLEDLTSGQRDHRATSETSDGYEDIDNVTCSGNSNVTMVDNSAYVTCTRMRTQQNSAYTTVQPHDVRAEPENVYEDVSHITDC